MEEGDLNRIFNSLKGTWILERDVPGVGALTGEVVFRDMGDNRLLYSEAGKFQVGGQELEALREYIYELRDGKLVVLYHDPHRKGDVLHELEFKEEGGDLVARHCHVCHPDTYDITFRLTLEGQVKMSYTVQGPKKDYEIISTLTRKL
jgi:hypothetical protein